MTKREAMMVECGKACTKKSLLAWRLRLGAVAVDADEDPARGTCAD